MNTRSTTVSNQADLPNGSAAAAILAAGIGSFLVALLAIVADQSANFKSFFNFYRPTGPLSGVTTTAITAWLISWWVLDWRWRSRTVALKPIVVVAFTLLVLSFLLTFPPLAELVN